MKKHLSWNSCHLRYTPMCVCACMRKRMPTKSHDKMTIRKKTIEKAKKREHRN